MSEEALIETSAPRELTERIRALPGIQSLLEAATGLKGLYLVGGEVRDLLLEQGPKEYDLVYEGDTTAAANLFADRLGGEVRIHAPFGTATVIAETLAFDLATARKEHYPEPGSLPEVAPATLAEDLPRRDFTINTFAFALDTEHFGLLRYVEGAQADLAAKKLRVMHPKSFIDDPTRLLRLLRYQARLGFQPEEQTEQLARTALLEGALSTVSNARIGNELRLLLQEPTATEALGSGVKLGIEQALHPNFQIQLELIDDALALLPPEGRADLTVLAACCQQFEASELQSWLDEMEYGAADREIVVSSATKSKEIVDILNDAMTHAQVGRLLQNRSLEEIAIAGALGAQQNAKLWLEELRHVKLQITGEDLIAAGIPEGPAIGKALQAALDAKREGTAGSRDDELAVARKSVK